ncbi:hypothetical protein J3458_001243 [Metarhizium acridum]|uniref:uncharacterized protein n=1 Tax=Metarhizium acridum TaxID=92637 RepID=UPI001C6C8179|nr:hypothetical protein J3458_001243 [Metarhizium acridum]
MSAILTRDFSAQEASQRWEGDVEGARTRRGTSQGQQGTQFNLGNAYDAYDHTQTIGVAAKGRLQYYLLKKSGQLWYRMRLPSGRVAIKFFRFCSLRGSLD